MSSRKRRSSGRMQENESPVPEEELDKTPKEPPRRKRRSASAAGGDGAEDASGAAAAGAGAGTGAGTGRGAAADETTPGSAPRFRQDRVTFNQQEANDMMAKIKALEEEAEIAQDKAAGIDIAGSSLQTAVARVVRFLLFRHHEKPGVPVKRQDINDVITAAANVPKGGRVAKKLPAVVLPLAAAQLAKTFGLELRELKRHATGEGAAAGAAAGAAGGSNGPAAAAAAAAAGGPGGQMYKLLSMLPTELLMHYGQHIHENQERGFMTLVLALLQLNPSQEAGKTDYIMEEEELWRHLGQCGVDREDPDAAETFGKHPKKILEIMEHSRSDGYLVKSKRAAAHTEQGMLVVYSWGEAAHGEFGGGLLEGLVDQWLKGGEGGDD